MTSSKIADNTDFDAPAVHANRALPAVTVTDSDFAPDSPCLARRIEALLPQTQCTKCGYDDCHSYAQAMAAGKANCNQCPPGGAEGIARLAHLLEQPVIALNPANGVERARAVALIDEALCIGCTLCLQACPVDAIVGAPKQIHTVVSALCTGCDLCVAPCPVDCIAMRPVTGAATGWRAWSPQQASDARTRYERRKARLTRERDAANARAAARYAHADAETASSNTSAMTPSASAEAETKKRAIIAAALERARQKKAELAARGQGPRHTENVSAAAQAQSDAARAHRTQPGTGTGTSTTPHSGPSTDRPSS